MIIVEGPDGSGKSTLVEALEEHLNIKASHFGGPPKTMQEIDERVRESLGAKLLDRWSPISEQVYAPIRGEKRSIDTLDHYINTVKPFIIYCAPGRRVLMANKERCLEVEKAHKSKEHCDTVSKNFKKIISLYSDVMKKLCSTRGLTVYYYDYTKYGELDKLVALIKKREFV